MAELASTSGDIAGMAAAWVVLSAGGVFGVVLMLGRWAEARPVRRKRGRR